jgi:hypothetical protein
MTPDDDADILKTTSQRVWKRLWKTLWKIGEARVKTNTSVV